MNSEKTYFVDVIIPIALNQEFTYRIPLELNDKIQIFTRVIVPFRGNKFYTALVTKIHENAPTIYQAKYIDVLLDENPLITPTQYELWKWMARYYMSPIGDVMNAALPANFKLASETKVILHPDFNEETTTLSDREFMIVEALSIQEILDLKSISEICEVKSIQPIIKKMIDRRIILSVEELSDRFSEKTAVFVEISTDFKEEEFINHFINELSSKKGKEKQVEAILHLLKLGGFEDGVSVPVLRKELEKEGVSVSTIQSLEKKGFFECKRQVISRLNSKKRIKYTFPQLNDSQKVAFDEINELFKQKEVVLLEGVTGSGKTEIYIKLIEEQLNQGKQTLLLVPEIALTTQLIQRLSDYFGEQIGVYHSRFNGNERVEIWNTILSNNPSKYRIVIGARSAIFLPFRELGLIIVDEEHETSYKQNNPSPRYNGRDLAIVLAKYFHSKVVLGSATPSLETYYNAKNKKYGHVRLLERYSKVALPEITFIDLKIENKAETLHGHFSAQLLEEMKATKERGEQIILFQNRRGYTPIWTCETCAFSPGCINCDTTLNYHKSVNILKCHYCSYQTSPIGTCPACGSNRLNMKGFGTEKLEDDLSLLLPDFRVERMDLDTTRSKNAHAKIIEDFDAHKIDVLIGTQMVAKGLDFERVGLVGVLDADMLLYKVNFRQFEKGFQLLSQVAGRSGRRETQGKVLFQTYNPTHWVLEKIQQHDFTGFAETELIERQNYHYPPFYKIIRFVLQHKKEEQVKTSAIKFAQLLQPVFFERVQGPEAPIIGRIQTYFLQEIHLKLELSAPLPTVKERIKVLIDQFYSEPFNKSVRLQIDVDPYN